MTKEEIVKAIKDGDSIWWTNKSWRNVPRILEITKLNKPKISYDSVHLTIEYESHIFDVSFYNLYKNKSQAQHYLDHANIERTEKLPFVTWEEFWSGKEITFTTNHKLAGLFLTGYDNEYLLIIGIANEKNKYFYDEIAQYEATEENFYKAYDECVKLFKGEE